MRNMMILILMIYSITQIACSMGSKSVKEHTSVRDKSKTFFWPAKTKGTFITQTCIKRKKNKTCKEWKRRYLTVDNDWEYIRNTRMILVNENLFLGGL